MGLKDPSKWIYDRADHRWKHCWNKPHADFVPRYWGQVGKCSNQISDEVATDLLQDSLRDGLYVEDSLVPGDDDSLYPEEVFAVYDGAIYVAVPTRPGISYHGYPYKGTLNKRLMKKLQDKAEKADCSAKFKKWVKEHIK
ncbi:hypothetical protein FHW75_003954 [Pseudomonas sp. OG7]|uniref:hypothetical protein n=1 Tax=Pseudomonas sp. OG7 TaxID=2587037 RepID=UPI001614FDA0|nr:hypothetical protein [Pseudomonas sp. OG7]MBB3272758.1 hypothetical protein [Pseudomonas sp. OG7]